MTPMTEVIEAERQAKQATTVHVASPQRRFYQPELDGLRFYAFLGVFMFHTLPSQAGFYSNLHLPFPSLWAATIRSGASGVDLFFTLSAFLITSILLRELRETGEISLRLFYIRRILRIWPLYFMVLGLSVVVAHTVPKQNLAWYYVVGFLFFVGNWVIAVCGHPDSVGTPLWTVSIEEQFYLLWPLAMKLLKPRGMIVAAAATFIVATVSQVGVVIAGLRGGYIYYGSVSRCAPLALGILLALLSDRLPQLGRGMRCLLLVAGLVTSVAASGWLIDQPGKLDERMVAGRFLVSIGTAAILWACLWSRSRLLRTGWIVQLGKISFGLYALHILGVLIPVSLLHASQGWHLLAAKGIGLGVTILLALSSYRWVESPFLRLKDRYATVLSRPV